MRPRALAVFITIAIILSLSIGSSAGQSGAALPNSPQPKSATTAAGGSQSDDPTKKLGAFLGKWESEGAFAGGQKTSTSLECRWSPQGFFLVCDQVVRMADEHRQFTVYSYDSKTGNYSYTTLADPGAKPSSGEIVIKGNLWTYDSSFTAANGKTTMIRTTNEFTDAKTEVFKVSSSDDGGATWKIALEGKTRKVGD